MLNKIAIFSNFNSSFLINNLNKKFILYENEGFNQWLQNLTDPFSKLLDFSPDFIFILFDFNYSFGSRKSIVEQNLELLIKSINSFSKNHPEITIFISNIYLDPSSIQSNDINSDELTLIKLWEEEIIKLTINSNIHLFNLLGLILKNGSINSYSSKIMALGSFPYTIQFISVLTDKIDFYVNALTKNKKKVICVDLDNTLWGGVLGDLGPENIKLGVTEEGYYYKTFQQKLLKLKNLGILLCIVSKNDYLNVKEVFQKNSHMILSLSDFIIVKANWNNKSNNILEISQELNLGLNSFVFIDDNQFEINEVKSRYPEIESITFNNYFELPQIIDKIYNDFFYTFKLTKEDKSKQNQYENIKKRNDFKNTINNFEDFLLSLDMKISVNLLMPSQTDRAFQLINKTNQFNLTTERYSEGEFLSLQKKGYSIFVANLSDRFADEGLIFVLIGRQETNKFYIDNIVMSCRVMGRRVENAIFELIQNYLFNLNINLIYGKYIKSTKNHPVEKLFSIFGFFKEKSENNIDYYKKELNSIENIAIIKAKWKYSNEN